MTLFENLFLSLYKKVQPKQSARMKSQIEEVVGLINESQSEFKTKRILPNGALKTDVAEIVASAKYKQSVKLGDELVKKYKMGLAGNKKTSC